MNNYFKNLRRRAGTGPGCTRHRGRYGSPGSSGGGNFLLRMKGAAILVMLLMCLLPQKAAAATGVDWKRDYMFQAYYANNAGALQFVVTIFNKSGTDEGFVNDGGVTVYASKDGGSNWTKLVSIRADKNGSVGSAQFWNGTERENDWWSGDDHHYRVTWNLPLEWRNCNIKFKSEGYWADYDGATDGDDWHSDIFGPYANNYTFSVRSISWNGDLGISPDGTLTLPYSFGESKETDGHTRISTHINGNWSSQIAYHTPSSNYASGNYSFNLSKINKNLRSPSFTIRMDHEFPHENDLNGGTQYFKAQSSLKTFYPLPLATLNTPVFNKLNRTVSLSWTADNTNYGDGSWAIYRNDQRIDVVPQGTYSYTDDEPLFEANVKYYIYYVHSSWSNDTKADLLKSNEQTVDARLSLPIANLSPVCEDDRIIFSWTSDGYPADYGHSFKIYVDDETNPIYTIEPTDNQTSFRWEHRTTDQHTDRQDFMDGNIPYTEEPLNACAPHNYRIDAVIGSTVVNSMTLTKKAIGKGTSFYSIEATKGVYPGTVKLQWHVNLQGSTVAKTYIVERRRAEKSGESWTTLNRMSSTEEYLMYTDDTPLPGVFYEYRVTVQDKCPDGAIIANEATDIGFAQTSGTISGRITFGASGSAVANVDVEAKRTGASSDDAEQYHAMRFTGTNGAVTWTYPTASYAADMLSSGNFTIQMWIQPDELAEAKIVRLNGEDCYVGMNANGELTFSNNGTTYTFTEAVLTAGKYHHVVLTRNGGNVTASVMSTDSEGLPQLLCGTQAVGSSLTMTGNTQLTVGHFKGYVDEFRLWTKVLTEAEIIENYGHLLVGNEVGLETYWTFDEGLRTQFFDYSRDGTVYHQHHGKIGSNAEPSNLTPTDLKLKAKTDDDGNYIIQGVPFTGEGTTYAIIPKLGVHQFNPTQQLRFVGNNSLVHNGTDFTDISAFSVKGTIRYAGTDYPVEGVNLYVDNQICAKDGAPITTNAYGQYEISVPIGEHYITVVKNGHEFNNSGRYPADPDGVGTLVNFKNPVTSLDFEDQTLVNFTGRVVGGSIEGEKPVGFGLSENNIGVVELVVSPMNELYRMNVVKNVSETTISYDTNEEVVAVASATEAIKSTSYRGATADYCKKIFIHTDPQTGEFSAMLPPLQYKVESMKVVKTEQDLDVSTTFDLTNPLQVSQDSVRTESDELLTYDYVAMLKHTYHSTPSFTVKQKGRDDGSFGINSFKLKDQYGDLTINDIYSVTNGEITYNYSSPLFVKSDPYTFQLSGFEEYTNYDGTKNVTSHVPLSGVIVTINNALSDGQSVYVENGTVDGKEVKAGDVASLRSNQIVLDDKGEATYKWTAGFPNITEPFTRTININYDIDGRSYAWSGNGMNGIVLGDLPSGNNFVTSGPDQLLMILRDPPGSASNAEWSTGTVNSTSTTISNGASEDGSTTFEHKFGVDVETISGILPGVATVNQVSVKNDSEIGVTFESSQDDSDSYSTTTTITKSWATKGEPEYVGADGDVFIGNATNVVFGKARNLGFRRASSTDPVSLNVYEIMTSGMRFGTLFSYTQKYIEETLFPNLLGIRDYYLKTVNQAEYDNPVNNLTEPIYVTTLDKNDENYGKPETYKIVLPDNMSESLRKKLNEEGIGDTIRWVNNQIENWTRYLALNEKEKVEAVTKGKLLDNYSFDSGSDVSYSVEKDSTHTSSFEWSVSPGIHIANTTGTEINRFGLDISFEVNASYSHTESEESETSNVSSFAFTLSETGDADALSVDVYQYGIYSPIFRTRGGQTSAPYEGEVRTSYYEPGEHVLMAATMQIEVPQIDVEVPVVSDIPSGQAANYVLKLSNASEVGADVAYRLGILDETNPDGAELTMDGKVIPGLDQGRLIKVPGNQTLTKALQLRQTNPGVLDYEGMNDDRLEDDPLYKRGIAIVFASDNDPEDIADTIYISAHFVPSASTVDLKLANNIVNTQTGTNLKLTFNNFDRNYHNQKAFRLQYKKQGNTDWTLLREYVLDEKNLTENNELLPATGANIDYMLDMNQFTDGDYQFRVLSVATYGNDEVSRSSEELALTKDMQRPRPLGQPEPADGILSAGDELSVTFNELILKGELTQAANFKVTGVLNGAEVAHETALSLQSAETTAKTEADILLGGKDFSIDTWINLTGGAGTLLSHGIGTAKLTVGTDTDNHLVVKIGSETYTSANPLPTGNWAFLTLSYKNENGTYKLTATVANDAFETPLFNAQEVAKYEGNGPLSVGCGSAGAMHELLLWDEAHDMTTALAQRGRTKNPATRHLIGYWKMDEGEGKTIRDYSRNRHMTMADETWYMNNENKAVSLTDGNFLSIDAGDLPSFSEDDYAVEFWVRGGAQTGEAQLLQMGEVGLWVNTNGELQLTGKGAYKPVAEQTGIATSSGNIMDNAWHHVALNVLRQGAAAVYVDGVRRLSTNAANVGGIATNNLLLGTHRRMVMNDEEGVYAYDRKFTGQVDEVRVWNATLNADKLLSNRKQRLTGTEDGLSAYYPFETKTIGDGNQVVTTASAEDLARTGHTAVALGGSSAEMPAFTDNAPALRQKKTETNVPFTFVASNEKVVITIDEEPAMIEGCTLNFTVRDVRDENGNYSLPAVWSAFVNQNQLVWAENSLALEQPQNTTGTLQATVVNKGGQQQMWTLSGMPAWLVPSTESGETNPLSETKVDFTVMPSAPLGRSEVTVYLTGNDNIDVPLTFNIKVTGDKPAWAVNPHNFEGSMNVIGQLYVDGLVSEDADDVVAAFIGEECRGVANLQYSPRYDGYFVTMSIYGNDGESGDVTFRAYDASTGTVYPVVNPNESISYTAQMLKGTYAKPVVLSTADYIEQQTELGKGWNWMSLYVTNTDGMTPQAVFEKIADDVLIVKSQNGFVEKTVNGLKGDLASLAYGKMYAVQMANDRTLRLVGNRASGEISVAEGWNWLGYGQKLASVGDAMANLNPEDGDIVRDQEGVAYFDDYAWAGSLLTMQPGWGYQVYSNKAVDNFSYPNSVTGAAASRRANSQSSMVNGQLSLFAPVDYHLFADNMVMTAQVMKDGVMLTDAEIGVFADGDECRATATTDEEGRAYITIPGDEACQLTFMVAVDGKVYSTKQTADYAVDAVCGSYSQPFVINLGDATGIEEIENGTLKIGNAVYDLQGRKVVADKAANCKMSKGVYIVDGKKKVMK